MNNMLKLTTTNVQLKTPASIASQSISGSLVIITYNIKWFPSKFVTAEKSWFHNENINGNTHNCK